MALEKSMIKPFEDRQVRKGTISYGLSSYGYDIRIADEFKIFTNINTTIVDPKGFDPRSFVDYQGEVALIPPNSFALGRSVEYFKIPRNVLTICVGKSTYARCGIITNVTPFEPEWEGYVTLEISNTTPPRCRPRSTPMRGSLRCCSSSRTSRASCRTRIDRGSTRASRGSCCPRSRPGTPAPSADRGQEVNCHG
jgi:deoxycytidine triphosphate deaminase